MVGMQANAIHSVVVSLTTVAKVMSSLANLNNSFAKPLVIGHQRKCQHVSVSSHNRTLFVIRVRL